MTNFLVKGSLSAVAAQTGASLAESFLNVDAVIVVDVSGSMILKDVDIEARRSRWDEAKHQLEHLQGELPGKVAVIAFQDEPTFQPTGVLPSAAGGTDMLAALKFIKIIDGCGVRLILLSDGCPDDPAATLKFASNFATPIDCIFIGSSGDSAGKRFMEDLARATGGVSCGGDAGKLGLLSETVRRLLK